MTNEEGNTSSRGKGYTKYIELVIRQSKKTLIAATADGDTGNKNKKKRQTYETFFYQISLLRGNRSKQSTAFSIFLEREIRWEMPEIAPNSQSTLHI